MSVEGGGISAGIGGPSIGGGAVGSAISMGPSVGISAPSMEGDPVGGFSPSFVNEGPVAPGFLENTMPLSLNRFKTPHQTVSVVETGLPSGQEAVDIAEQWLGISSQPQKNHYILDREVNGNGQQRVVKLIPKLRDFTWTRPAILPFLHPESVGKPKNEPKIQPKSGQIEFSKVAPRGAILTELNTRSVQQSLVGQNLEEEVFVKEKVYEKPEISEREEIEELKLKDLLDEEVAEQRVYEISEAIDLAETEAKSEGVEEIDGPRILKFLRLHIGLISQIARKIRKDGSLDETLEELAARRFSSKNQAKEQTKELVAQKEPVRRGKEGKAVKEGALERVFKYHFVKRSPKEEVVKRVVKKQIQPGHQTAVQVQAMDAETREPRIEDDADLAEVFLRKAA